jgi:hypothetical protein
MLSPQTIHQLLQLRIGFDPQRRFILGDGL